MADYVARSVILKDYNFLLSDLKQINKAKHIYSLWLDGIVPNDLKGLKPKDIDTLLFDRFESAERKSAENLANFGDIWLECIKLDNSNYQRKNRLRKRISTQLQASEIKSYFLTLTFKNEVIASTSAETRRKYVRRFLKRVASDYVANIDFGVDPRYTEREHYHAVVNSPSKIDLSWWQQHCGFAFAEKIRYDVASEQRLSKYITKLSNHAVKESATRNHLIYSRQKKEK